MDVATLVGRTVAQLGVGHAFGVVGSGNFVVTNALREHGVPFVAARHEGGAATMADAYARTTDEVAVLSLHQGCGLTNALTGIAEAAKSRTPLLVLVADTPGAQVRSNFRIDQDALVRGVGAVAERVHSPASAVADTVRAWRTARSGRRTVVLNLPLDVQAAAAPDDALGSVTPVPAPDPVAPGTASVAALVELLAAARRPVFVAGRGARGHGALLRALGERTGALLATSAVAKGLFLDDPVDLGISGGFSTPVTAGLISGADLVVGWGCSLTVWTTRHGRLIGPDAALVQVDADEDALGANRAITLGVHGDVGRTAAAVLASLDETAPVTGYRTPEVLERIATRGRWTQTPTEDLSTPDTIDPRVLSAELEARLPAERVLAVDSGNFMGYPSGYLTVPDEKGFCFTQSFQSIGLGLATMIGAALASPGRLPVLGTGDGGFLMAASELETLVRLRLGGVVVVYDDAAYGAEVHHFGPSGGDTGAVTFPDVDIAAMARGAGCEGIVVRTVDDLAGLDTWLAGSRDVPLVIDAKIADDGGSWWLAEAFRAH